jgi:hypothetical protein
VVSFTPRPLYPQGKSSSYPLYKRLGGSQSPSRRSDEEKNSQPLPGLEPPIIQPVVQPYITELSRILFHHIIIIIIIIITTIIITTTTTTTIYFRETQSESHAVWKFLTWYILTPCHQQHQHGGHESLTGGENTGATQYR